MNDEPEPLHESAGYWSFPDSGKAIVHLHVEWGRLAGSLPMSQDGNVSGLTSEVARVPSTVEAQIIVGLLESNGVDAAAQSDDAGGQEPQWQLTQGVRVLVAPEDEARARELIAEAEAGGL